MSKRLVNIGAISPCLFAIIVDYAGYGLVFPLVAAMFTETQSPVFPGIETPFQRNFVLGLSYILYPLFMFFGSSFLGDLSDKWGRKKVLLLSMTGIFISFLTMAVGVKYHVLALFLIGRAVSGLMAGSQPLSQAAVADLSSPENRAWNMGLVTLTSCISVSLGPAIAGVFSEARFQEQFGYSLPFLVAAFLGLVAVIWIFLGFKETLQEKRDQSIDLFSPLRIFLKAFLNKQIRLLAIVVILFQTGFAMYYQFIAVYFRMNFAYQASSLGYYYAYMGLCFALGILVVLPFALKRWSIGPIACISLTLMALFQIASMLYVNDLYNWILFAFIGSFNTVAYAAILTLFSGSADEKSQGWVMGIFASAVAVSYVTAGSMANLLSFIGSRSIIFLGGVLALVGGYLLIGYLQPRPAKNLESD